MTRILRMITAGGFIWWLIAASMAVAPQIETDPTGGYAAGLALAWLVILVLWLLIDTIIKRLGDLFGRQAVN
jgi:hypothetical protein